VRFPFQLMQKVNKVCAATVPSSRPLQQLSAKTGLLSLEISLLFGRIGLFWNEINLFFS